MILAGCAGEYGGERGEYGGEYGEGEQSGLIGTIDDQDLIPRPAIPYFSREQLLYDLDYLMYALEENFALFDVAYWARGIDIPAMATSAKAGILGAEYEYMNRSQFIQLLTENFEDMLYPPFAHFRIRLPTTRALSANFEPIGRTDSEIFGTE